MTVPVIPRWADDYRRIPFTVRGASHAGCKCWGLVHLVLKERVGIEVDPQSYIGAGDLGAVERAFHEGAADTATWRPVDRSAQRPFDVVLMLDRVDALRHCGIMVSRRHVLHTEKETDVCCVPLDHYSIASRVVSFHRHKDLPEQP